MNDTFEFINDIKSHISDIFDKKTNRFSDYFSTCFLQFFT